MLAGDFNQWPIEHCIEDFIDMEHVTVGPTRGDREIDKTFVNFARAVTASGTLPPLETEADPG